MTCIGPARQFSCGTPCLHEPGISGELRRYQMKPDDNIRDVVMISPFPRQGKRSFYGSGVVTYAQKLAWALADHYSVSVIADKLPGLPAKYQEEGVTVYRAFKPGPLYPIRVFRALRRVKADVVHIQHSYFLYGGFLEGILFPFLVLLCRSRSRVVVTMHDLPSLEQLDDGDFQRQNLLPKHGFLLKTGIKAITKAIGAFASIIVVHEAFMRDVAVHDYGLNERKVVVVPHGVDRAPPHDRGSSRESLGIHDGRKLILFFGYLIGYKGIETLISAFRDRLNDGRYSLIIAGGDHPRAREDPSYRRWLNGIIKEVNDLRAMGADIRLTGFVEDPSVYFSAADMVVLPYVERFAASGPAAAAASYGLPLFLTDHGSSGDVEADIIHFIEEWDGHSRDEFVPYWDIIAKGYYSFVRPSAHGDNQAEDRV